MLLQDTIRQDIEKNKQDIAQLSESLSIEVSPDQYNFITRQLAEAEDPKSMEIDIASAITYSRNLNLPLDYCMQNLKDLTKVQIGTEYAPTATSLKAIKNSFEIGKLTTTRSELANQFRDLYMAGQDYSGVQAEIEKVDSQIEALQDYVPRNWLTQSFKFAANTIPYTGRVIMKGIEGGALAALGLKAAAAIGGISLAAAPIAGVGAIAATTVASAVSAIAALFRAKETRDLTAGSQFYDMVVNGINPNVANSMSEISGWLSGAIEGGLGGLTSSTLEAVGMSPASFASRVSTRLFLNGKMGQIANGAMRYISSAAGEGLEEFTETIKDSIIEAISYELSDLEQPIKDTGTIEQALDDFVGGFASSLVLGGLPAVLNTRRDAKLLQQMKADAIRTESFEVFRNNYEKARPENIIQEDWDQALKDIWNTQSDARSSLQESYANYMNTRAVDISENVQYDEEGNIIEPETLPRSGDIDRLPNGMLYTQDSKRIDRLPGNIEEHTLKIGSYKTGESYGYITYRISPENKLSIQNVRTYEGYDTIAKEAIQNLIKRYPDMEITWDSDNEFMQNIKDAIIAENPRGTEYGLNYGEQFSKDDRTEIMNRIGNLFSTETSVNSALATLVQLVGSAQGITGTQWLDNNVKAFERFEESGRKGATSFIETAEGMKAVIYAGKNADATTFEHELVHVIMSQNNHKSEFVDIFNSVKDSNQFKNFVDSTGIIRTKSASFEKLFKDKNNWSVQDEEFLAELYEAWRTTGQTSNTKLNQFFRRISEWFRSIYNAIRPTGILNKEVSDFFDSFYAKKITPNFQTTSTTDTLYQSQHNAEEQAVIDQYKNTDQWLKAPNGEETNLTEKQWIQVRTPSFKAWFGDWENDPANASKVVDENGEPKVVYHGTASRFDIFNKKLLGKSTKAKSAKAGFFFADNIRTTEGYSIYAQEVYIRDMYARAEVLERKGLFDEAEKLYMQAEELSLQDVGSSIVMSIFLSIKSPKIIDAEGADFKSFDFSKILFENDSDGIIVYDLNDNIKGDYIANHYIAFEPNQIKSATENIGTFDPNNPSILYQADYGNGGYNWQQGMSNRAVRAYEMGEMPKSKWTKEAFKETLYEMIDVDVADVFLKLPVSDLKDILLKVKSWHHTGKYFNETNFYGIRSEIQDVTKEQAEKFVSDYKEYKKNYKEYEKIKKENTQILQEAFEKGEEIEIRYKGRYVPNIFTEKVKFYEEEAPFIGKMKMFEAKAETEYLKDYFNKIINNLPDDIKSFLEQNYDAKNISQSNKLYEQGRKPSPIEYNNPNYFKNGERRLSIDYNQLILEEYSNGEWKSINNISFKNPSSLYIYWVLKNETIKEEMSKAELTKFTEEELSYPSISMPWAIMLYQSEDGATTIQDIKGSLILTHTLDIDILPEIEKLKGIPMPSLGITKPDLQYNLNIFGNVTLIGSETLANRMVSNQWIYDRDLSSPMVPSEYYKIDTENIINFINDLRETINPKFNNPDIDFYFISAMEKNIFSPSDLAKKILSKWMGLYKTYADRLAISLDIPMKENNQVDLMAFAKYMLDNDSKRKQITYALRKDIEKFFKSYFINEEYKFIPFTAENILDYMKNKPLSFYEYNVISSIDELKTQAEQLDYDDVSYFEAKPQEVMQLSDFTAALIPSDLAQGYKDILSKAGLKLLEYNPETRAQKLREYAERTPGILFQSSYDYWLQEAEDYIKYASDFDDFNAYMYAMVGDEGRPENSDILLKQIWLKELNRRREEEPERNVSDSEINSLSEELYSQQTEEKATLRNPNEKLFRTESEKDTHFLSILQDDSQVETFFNRLAYIVDQRRRFFDDGTQIEGPEEMANYVWLEDVANQIETGIAPYINNLFYSQKKHDTQTYNKIRGYVAANIRYYRNLYGLASEIDYWKGNMDYEADIKEYLPEDFETLSFSERARVVQSIKNENLRKAIFSGKEPYQNGEVEKLIRSLDEKIKTAKEESEQQQEKIKKLNSEVISLSVQTSEQWKKIKASIDERLKLEKDLQKISENIAEKAKKNLQITQDVVNRQQTILQRIQTIRKQEEQYIRGIKNQQAKETLDKKIFEERLKAAKKYEDLKKKSDEKISSLKNLYKERAALRKVKSYKEKLARIIMRQPSANVNWEEAEAILAIQGLVDPTFRKRMIINGKSWTIEELKNLLKNSPDDIVLSSLKPEKLEILYKKNLNDWTIEELEDLASAVNYLRKEGLQKRQAYIDAQRSRAAMYQRILIQQILDSGKTIDDPISGTKQSRTNEKSFLGKMSSIYSATINMARKAQILDNNKKGVVYDLLIRQKRELNATELRNMKQRSLYVENVIKENNLNYTDLYKNYQVDIDGKIYDMTFSQLAYIYLSQFNERNKQAVAYGTFVTNIEKRQINNEVLARIPGSDYKAKEQQTELRNQMVMEIGDRRYDEVLNFATRVMAENPDLFKVVEAVRADFNNGKHFNAIKEIMLKVYNQQVIQEENYLPIYRNEIMGEPAQKVKEDIMNQIPGTRGSLEKGFTQTRLDISPYNQLKIDYDLFKVWQDSVFMQEHTLANLEYVRMLNSVFINRGSQSLRDYISQAYGSSMMKAIDTHIKEIANPKAFESNTEINRLLRMLKGSLYSAYLGYKTSGVILQAITSPAPFLAKVGGIRLTKAYLEMMLHPTQMWQTITTLSPFIENRSYDLLGGWIQEQLKEIDLSKKKRLLLQFQNVGMQGLEWIDRFTVAGGWYAVYQQELENMQEGDLETNIKKAAAAADEFVQETQPQSDITELSPMFKNRTEAMNILTQFQASLNVIWQNVTYDIPTAFKNHQYREALGMITGYMIAGALLYLVQEGFEDDDDDKDKMRKILYSMTTQISSGIPLVSSQIDNVLQRLITGEKAQSWGTTVFPAFEKFVNAFNKIVDGDYKKALQYVLEATALANGLPYSGAKEIQAALTTDVGLSAFIGRRE